MSNKSVDLKVWSIVENCKEVRKSDLGITLNNILKAANKEAGLHVMKEPKRPNRDVLLVAKFIANMEPSYLNSQSQPITLQQVRAQVELDKETVKVIVGKIKEVVEPYISVTAGEESLTNKLKVNSKLSKGKLIEAAIKHLLTGCEVTPSQSTYAVVKSHSLLNTGYYNDYLTLAAVANALHFNSVHEMMDAFVLNFEDQRTNLETEGVLVFKNNGTVKVPMGG